ncbi:hypothetical protein [Bacillus marasmi]|uniref:hypothetical protein n=1 Tax=Bacillus marasmi TaxID=1926279 RepID=UPI0011CB3CB6|nr:hypothetical protein [Bacillus marasmi]
MNDNSSKFYKNQSVVASVNPFVMNTIGIYHPGVIAWWSAALPGFGHLILGHYLIGFILITHEMITNTLSGLNSAIVYSMIGDFEMAKQMLNKKWIIAYICPYIFAIWDGYQRTIQLNNDYKIAMKRGYEIASKDYSIFGLNRLSIKNPILAVLWSIFAPGIGYVYINQMLMILLVPWFVMVFHLSHLLPAFHFTLEGDFLKAKQNIDPQWVLYLPSIYCFIWYDVFVQTLSNNKIYMLQQKRFLKKFYQNQHFPISSIRGMKEKIK